MMSTVYSVDLRSSKPNIVCQRCARKQTQAKYLSRVGKKNTSCDTTQIVEKTASDLIYLIPFYRSLRQDEKWRELRKKLDEDQTKKLVQWINNNLANSYRITNLYIDLSDGLRVAYLLEVLYNCHLNKESPITRLHRMKNFQTCIDFMEFSRQVKCIGINSSELVEGNHKILLGFLFLIRHDYEYKYCREILTISNERISDLKTVPQILPKNDNKIQKIIQNSEIMDKLERVDSLPQYQESLKSESKSSVFSFDLDDSKSVERARNIDSFPLVNGSYDSLESDDKFSNVKNGLSSKSMSDIESIPNSSQTDSLVDLMSSIQKVSAEMKNKLDNCLKELSNSEESIDTEYENYPNSELSKFEETIKETNNGFIETEIFENEGSAESIEPKNYLTERPLFETNEINKKLSQYEKSVEEKLFKNINNCNSYEQIVPVMEEIFGNDDQVLPVRNNLSDHEFIDLVEKNEEQSINNNFSKKIILKKESASKKNITKYEDSSNYLENENSIEYLTKETCEIIDQSIQDLDDFKKDSKEQMEFERTKENQEINGDLNNPDIEDSASSSLVNIFEEKLDGQVYLSNDNLNSSKEDAHSEQIKREKMEFERTKENQEKNGDLNNPGIQDSASSSLIDDYVNKLHDEASLINENLKNSKENVTDDNISLCDLNNGNNNDRNDNILNQKEQVLDEGNISECEVDFRKNNNYKSLQNLSENDKLVDDFDKVDERKHQNLSDNDQNFAEKISSDLLQHHGNEFIIESMIDSLVKDVCELFNLNGKIDSKIISGNFEKLNQVDQNNQNKLIVHKVEENFEKESVDPKSSKYNFDEINCENKLDHNLIESIIRFNGETSKNRENTDQETFQDGLDSDLQNSPKVDSDVRVDQQKDSETAYQSFLDNGLLTDHLFSDLNKVEKNNHIALNENIPELDQVNCISVENSIEQIEQTFLDKDEKNNVHRLTDQNSESNEEDLSEIVENHNDKTIDIVDRLLTISENNNENVKILTIIDPSIDQNDFSQDINGFTDEKKCADCPSSQKNKLKIENLKLDDFTLDDLKNLSDFDYNSVSKHSKHESENFTSSFKNEILDETIDVDEKQQNNNSILEIEVMPKNNIIDSNSEHLKKTYSSIVQQNHNEKPLEKTRNNENEKLELKKSGHLIYKLKSNSASKQNFSKSLIKNKTNKPVYEENKFLSKPLVKKFDSDADRSVETKNKFKELDCIDLQSNLENELKSPFFSKSNGTIISNGNKNKSIRKKAKTNSIIFSESDDYKAPCRTLEFFKIFILTLVFITFSLVINHYFSL